MNQVNVATDVGNCWDSLRETLYRAISTMSLMMGMENAVKEFIPALRLID